MSEPRPQIWVMAHPPFEDDLLAALAEVGDVHRATARERAELLAEIADADAVIGHVPADAELFDAVPRLRLLSTVSVGYNHIDVAEAARRGIVVCHTPGVLDRAVTDVTMLLVFALALRFRENEAYVRTGGWAAREVPPPLGTDVRGLQFGIVGFGRIGQAVAHRMRSLGMEIAWFDRDRSERPHAPPARYLDLDELLATSDVVSIHANWEPGSPPLIGARELALMRPSAWFVNTARGPLVDQVALTEALRSGAIAGAGLDVLHDEPPDPGEAIVGLDNVVCLPHVGSATVQTRRAMRELAVANLVAVLRGERPPAPVDAGVVDRVLDRSS